MIRSEKDYELIKFEDGDFSLDVKVSPSEDTVWLTQKEMATLFDVDRSRIIRHINNIYAENELDEDSTCAENAHMGTLGVQEYKVKLFNLDMIIAVGYRVNSKRGTQFRKWANSILKQYLLKGFAINDNRCLTCSSNILELKTKYENIESKIKSIEDTIYSNNSKIIYEGEILEPYTFLRKLFFLAKQQITIIDYYADKFLLTMLSDVKVNISIITSSKSYLNNETIPSNISIIHNDNIHDRFIIIDKIVYAMGTSFNDIGKHRFIIIKLNDITEEMLLSKKTSFTNHF